MTEVTRELLTFDPLAVAEKLTGQSYKEDDPTMNLGMGIAIMHNQRKGAILEAAGDTHYSMKFADALRVFQSMGFRVVLQEPFEGIDFKGLPNGYKETFIILWHPQGLLATLESYWGDGLNSSKVWYNILFKEGVNQWPLTSSGHMNNHVWVGDHDGREGIKFNVEQLAENGDFLQTWVERPFLWLLTYADTKVEGYDYNALNAARIAKLPPEVQAAIAGGTA
ncbi:MAG: hypothetical protein WC322_02985 [Candidatus Paceibacterota bacterium]|jgi:hypothetical protein